MLVTGTALRDEHGAEAPWRQLTDVPSDGESFHELSCVLHDNPGGFVDGDYLTVRGTIHKNWMDSPMLTSCRVVGMN